MVVAQLGTQCVSRVELWCSLVKVAVGFPAVDAAVVVHAADLPVIVIAGLHETHAVEPEIDLWRGISCPLPTLTHFIGRSGPRARAFPDQLMDGLTPALGYEPGLRSRSS